MSDIYTLASCFFIGFAFVSFFQNMKSGDSTPNPATWLLWAIVLLMNTVSYFFVVQKGLEVLVTLTAFVGTIWILSYAWRTSSFAPLKGTEWVCLIGSFLIFLYWVTSGNPVKSNIPLQFILLISFWPTFHQITRHGKRENPAPWTFGVIAHVFLFLALKTDTEDHTWIAYLFPLLDGLLGNGSIAMVAFYRAKHGFRREDFQ